MKPITIGNFKNISLPDWGLDVLECGEMGFTFDWKRTTFEPMILDSASKYALEQGYTPNMETLDVAIYASATFKALFDKNIDAFKAQIRITVDAIDDERYYGNPSHYLEYPLTACELMALKSLTSNVICKRLRDRKSGVCQ